MGYLISETTKEERERIVADSLGNIEANCDGCMAGLAEMYQDYIDGKKIKSKYDNIHLYVGKKSVMPFSTRPKWDTNEIWVEETLQLFGYHWKREDNKEYAI